MSSVSVSNVAAMLQNIKVMAGAEAFDAAVASLSSVKTDKAVKTDKTDKTDKTPKDPNAPKRAVPAGVTAWTEKVKGVLADMIKDGWEPFSVKETHFAGSEFDEKQGAHVFADSRKKPTYSQALTVAKIRKGSSSSSVASSDSESAPVEEEKKEKKGGRPKGSKNKPKAAEVAPALAPAAPAAPSAATAIEAAAVPLPESDAEDEGHSSDTSGKKRGRKPMTAEQKVAAAAERAAKMAAMSPEELTAFEVAKAAKKEANKAKKAAKEAKA